MSFPRYPSYKPTGVEWLGDIPSHWGIKPLKYVARLVTEKADDRMNPVALENIESWTGRLVPSDSQFEGEGTAFRPGDILFGKLRPYLAKAYLAEAAGEAVGDFHVLRPMADVCQGKYLQHQVLCASFIDIVNGGTFGSKMPRANWASLGAMPILLPARNEQEAIAAFLDRETAKIDVLVAEQRGLIEVLNEKRQAVISHAVTKGLKPGAPMKDSGVEWLGQVPAHYQLKKLRHVADIVRGASPRPAGDPKFFAGDNESGVNTPWVTVAEVTKDDSIYLTEVTEYLTPQGVLCSQSFLAGTLVFTNSGATLGVPKILAIDCCANDGILAFKQLSGTVESRFMYHYLSTTTLRLRTEMKQGGGQPNLNTGLVKDIDFPLPPLAEQSEIVEFIDRYTSSLDVLRSQAERATGLLGERRAALISAAVTGQIDVRPESMRTAA